jgi:CHASE2 domain-containing sensor protein
LPFIFKNKLDTNQDKLELFLYAISWILGVAAFIMFIIWLTKSTTNKNVLKIIWISAITTFIISIGLFIFLIGDNTGKIIMIPTYLIGYSFIIFIGSFIGFLVKNK